MNPDDSKKNEDGLTTSEEMEVYDIYEEIEQDYSPFVDSEEDLYLLNDEI